MVVMVVVFSVGGSDDPVVGVLIKVMSVCGVGGSGSSVMVVMFVVVM